MCCDVLVFETTSLCLATALRPPQLEGNGASKLWNLRFVCDVLGGVRGNVSELFPTRGQSMQTGSTHSKIYIGIHTYIHSYIYIHIHTYTHIYIYIHVYTNWLFLFDLSFIEFSCCLRLALAPWPTYGWGGGRIANQISHSGFYIGFQTNIFNANHIKKAGRF